MAKQLHIPEAAVDCFCKAFICEPCNERGSLRNEFKYIWKPDSLPLYLKDFRNYSEESVENRCVSDVIPLDNDLVLATCHGCGNGCEHIMLNVEKQYVCCGCNKVLCQTCNVKSNAKVFCISCYKNDLLQPYDGIISMDSQLLPESEMRKELAEAGQQLDAKTPIHVIQGLYDNLEILQLHRKLSKSVSYPVKKIR